MTRICAILFSLILMCGCEFGALAQERVARGSEQSGSTRVVKVTKRAKRYKRGQHPAQGKRGRRPQGHRSKR
ncbi:MAG: hypothetical protein ABSE21_11140 [Bryobacteraceae bacterium]|jgi:hypothetical protein